MAPPFSYRMANAIKCRRPIVLLAQIEHPNGTARFWSGIGTISWNGYEWTGAGLLGSVTPIRKTSEIAIQELEFTLSGVDSDVVSRLSDDVRNRAGYCWLACLDEEWRVVPDPIQIVDSLLDYQSMKIGEDGSVIVQITARSGFYTLERSLDDVWSPEDQRTHYAGDTGLDLIHTLQNQDIQWTPS